MIGSLQEYRDEEQKLKELLASLSAAGDMADKGDATAGEGSWKNVAARVATLKDELKAYRDSHPDEFQHG